MITSLLLSASLLFSPMHLDTQEQREPSIQVEATFYTAKCKGCIGVTKSGYNVKSTIYYEGKRVLAAPPEIPLYTEYLVELEDGTRFKGIVLDRGGDIKGNRLDILTATKKEAFKLGRQKVKLKKLEVNND